MLRINFEREFCTLANGGADTLVYFWLIFTFCAQQFPQSEQEFFCVAVFFRLNFGSRAILFIIDIS